MKSFRNLFLLFLICSIFMGCGNKNGTAVSAALKAEINEAWQKENGHKLSWDGESGYYGTYQGAVVFLYDGEMAAQAITEITVAGENFIWPNAFVIWVYQDAKFYDLSTAYEMGMLTQENVKSIAERHEDYLYTVTNWDPSE